MVLRSVPRLEEERRMLVSAGRRSSYNSGFLVAEPEKEARVLMGCFGFRSRLLMLGDYWYREYALIY